VSDVFTKTKRSAVMSRIRSKGNKETELRLIAIIWPNGITGWRGSVTLRVPGKRTHAKARRKADRQERWSGRSVASRLCEKNSKGSSLFRETGFCFFQVEAGGVCRRVFLARLPDPCDMAQTEWGVLAGQDPWQQNARPAGRSHIAQSRLADFARLGARAGSKKRGEASAQARRGAWLAHFPQTS